MGRGKRFGFNAKFHRYNCHDKKNCSDGNCEKSESSYAILKSKQRRREESDFYRRQPELVRKYSYFI